MLNIMIIRIIIIMIIITMIMITDQVSLAIVVGATGVFLVLLVAVMSLAFWRFSLMMVMVVMMMMIMLMMMMMMMMMIMGVHDDASPQRANISHESYISEMSLIFSILETSRFDLPIMFFSSQSCYIFFCYCQNHHHHYSKFDIHHSPDAGR